MRVFFSCQEWEESNETSVNTPSRVAGNVCVDQHVITVFFLIVIIIITFLKEKKKTKTVVRVIVCVLEAYY